ncbi:hypothetical protein CC2G_012476 [Coprinopsis cinerea AmutBmut pab1-1]|nr:hypothetical protein CC2G_012476 [Coprinopsis cinerea AmutBmut pab1-1]
MATSTSPTSTFHPSLMRFGYATQLSVGKCSPRISDHGSRFDVQQLLSSSMHHTLFIVLDLSSIHFPNRDFIDLFISFHLIFLSLSFSLPHDFTLGCLSYLPRSPSRVL